MPPSAAVTAVPAAAPIQAPTYAQRLSHIYKLSPVETFGPYGMYSQKQLSLRAVRFHLALIGMRQRRLIGEYRFQYIDLDEAARHVGSDHAKANSQALRELQAKGVWYQSDEGIWYPATDVNQLHIETQELRALRGWLASLTSRRFIVVPRLLFEVLPRLTASQIALNLELLTCCTWTGDKHEIIASKPVSLRLHRVAERWGMSYHTIQERLNNGNVSLGPHVRLTLDDNPPDWYLKEHGRRFLVTISKPATPFRKTRKAARQILHKCSLSKEGQKNPTPQGQKEHENPTPLILSLSPLLQRDLTPSSPANAAEDQGQDIGACQPEGGSQDKNRVTTDKAIDALPADTADLLPTDSDPEAQAIIPVPDIDTSPANTADRLPLDLKPEPTAETPAAADPPLPPADWLDIIPADLTDRQRLDALYDQITARRILPRGEASRLMVYTAARRALKTDGILNRPAFFRQIIQSRDCLVLEDGREVPYLTDEDEQAALAWIKAQQLAPVDRELQLVRQPDTPPALSEEAKIVADFLVHELPEKGYRGDPFHAFKQTDRGPDWTRPRWEAALAELETPPAPACLSPAVTPPGLLAWGSELAQIDPPIAALGLPTPAVNTSLQKPTEAPTPRREKMDMMTSQQESIPRPAVPLPGDEPVSLRYFSDARVLSDDGHLLKLYAEAVSSGLIPDDEDGFLRFVAAAEHALHAGGVPDRPQLFNTIVRGKWGLVPNAAIDRARERLNTMNFRRPSHGGADDVVS